MAKIKKQESKKVFLKQLRPHEKGFRLGRHIVTAGVPKEYTLNEKEIYELKGKGPQYWLKEVSKKEMDAMPKSNAENKKILLLKKQLAEKEIVISGEESLEELEALLVK